MQENYTDILIMNIRELMKKNSMTQEDLAEVLRIRQSQISKALSMTSKTNFTLDQVVRMADFFHVSVDFLIGRTRGEASYITQKETASMMAMLIESGVLAWENVKKQETVYEKDDSVVANSFAEYEQKKKTINYIAFYFPEVDNTDYPGFDPYLFGNKSRMYALNGFLTGQVEAYKLLRNGHLTDTQYQDILDGAINRLPDEKREMPWETGT